LSLDYGSLDLISFAVLSSSLADLILPRYHSIAGLGVDYLTVDELNRTSLSAVGALLPGIVSDSKYYLEE